MQRDRPMLVEFWDFCRPNSMRTLPYVKAWHERYAEDGLRVIGVHCPGFDALARRGGGARARWRGWGSSYPVLIDSELELWQRLRERGLAGALPVRRARAAVRVPLRRGRLRGNRAGDPGAARRRARAACAAAPRGRAGRDARGADARAAGRLLRARTRPAACGRCSTARARCARATRDRRARRARDRAPGAYPLLEHERHTAGELELELGRGRALPRRPASRRAWPERAGQARG